MGASEEGETEYVFIGLVGHLMVGWGWASGWTELRQIVGKILAYTYLFRGYTEFGK